MIKKSITIILGSCIINSSYAFNPIYPLTIIQRKNSHSPSIAKKGQNNFIDFSGIWKGKCIFNNYETEETVIIKNNANYIEFGNKHFIIGNSIYSESNTSSKSTYIDHRQLEWSEDGKSLNVQGTKVIGANQNKLTTYLFTNDMSLVNDQIVISIKVKGFQNMEVTSEDTGNCMLSRI